MVVRCTVEGQIKLMNNQKYGILNTVFVGISHPYHFVIDSEQANRIRGEYDYEWTDARI